LISTKHRAHAQRLSNSCLPLERKKEDLQIIRNSCRNNDGTCSSRIVRRNLPCQHHIHVDCGFLSGRHRSVKLEQAFHALQHRPATRGQHPQYPPPKQRILHNMQPANIVHIAISAQRLEHIACKWSSPTFKSRYADAVSWRAGRPTCHP
jgi:hypothetical protein